jgi:PAS domain S-box-containing protein
MNNRSKTKEELIKELQELQEEKRCLKESYEAEINEYRLKVESLKETEENFCSIFENNSAAIAIIEPDTTISMVNSEYCKMSGYTRQEVTGMSWTKQIPPGDIERLKEYNQKRLLDPNDAPDKYEFTFYLPDGEVRNALMSVTMTSNRKIIASFTDITERKRSELELQESEEKFRSIAENLSDVIYLTDENGIITYISPAASTVFGYGDDEMIGHSFSDFLGDDEKQRLIPIFRNAIQTGIPTKNLSVTPRRKDGKSFFGELSSNKIFKDDIVSGTMGLIRDVTLEKLKKDELRKLNKAVESAVEVIFMTDKEGLISYVNPAFTKVYGYESAEVVGITTPRILKSGQIDNSGYQQFWQTLLKTQVVTGELINKTKDDSFIHVDSSSTAILNELGEITGFLAIQRDITERKRVENELKEISQQLTDAQAIAKVGSWETNLLNFEVKWSKETFRIFDLDQNSFHTTHPNFLEFVHPEDRESVDKTFLGSLNSHDLNTIQHRIVTSSGIIKYIEENWRIIFNDQGQAIRALGTCSDITSRKVTEIALQKERLLLRSIINNLPDAIYLKDLDCRKTLVNLTELRHSGVKTESEIIGKDDFDIYPKELAEKFYADDQTILKSGLPLINREEFIPDENKQKRWLLTSKVPLWGLDNRVNGILGIGRDITDIKHAEDELIKAKVNAEESEKLLRAVFDNSQDAIGVALKGISVMVNQAYLNIFGYDNQNEIIGKSLLEQISPEEHDRIIQYITKRYLGEEVPCFYETTGLRKNGFKFPFELNVGTYILNNEKYTVGIIRDISARKLTERSLINAKEKAEESEKKLHLAYYYARSLIEASLDPLVTINAEGKITDVNEATIKVTELSRDELIGTDFSDYFTEPEKAKIGYLKVLEQGLVIDYPLTIRQSENKFVDVLYNGSIFHDEQGNVLGVFATARDITERKKAEKELIKAKERAEESDRLKSAFLANMSHEIRTPMNGILGFAELLKESRLSGEEQQEYIGIIEKSGKRMLNIINDIIDISKIESGQMHVNMNESTINEQIDYIYAFFKPEAEAKGLAFYIKNALPTKESIIVTDREKVFAILTNLVKNAIKYSDKGTIELGYQRKGDYLEFFVKDTGIGIPNDRQGVIFERFIQADIGDKRAFEGAGLGLAISRAYVEMLGGKIWLESEAGIGSTFYFSLPYNFKMEEKVTTEKDGSATQIDNPDEKLTILIADDDDTSRKLISIAVKKISKVVLEVKTGFEAVELCRKNPDIDLVLMDLKMPGLNGYGATRQIREFNKDVVIVAQTAYGLFGDKEKAIDAGCDDYISKPVNLTELKDLIQKYFKN